MREMFHVYIQQVLLLFISVMEIRKIFDFLVWGCVKVTHEAHVQQINPVSFSRSKFKSIKVYISEQLNETGVQDL